MKTIFSLSLVHLFFDDNPSNVVGYRPVPPVWYFKRSKVPRGWMWHFRFPWLRFRDQFGSRYVVAISALAM